MNSIVLKPYTVICDRTNNTDESIARGELVVTVTPKNVTANPIPTELEAVYTDIIWLMQHRKG